jgi:hypothetical protein
MMAIESGKTTVVHALLQKLERYYCGEECAWNLFFQPRWERGNFATRYHLVYPALAYFTLLKDSPRLAPRLRPQLDTIYRGLLHRRTWAYWHSELGEPSWPLGERNLTFAARLATFVGFYTDAFGSPPAESILLDDHTTTYHELSESLWRQMMMSPNQGVSCYHHQSMVMCNAHLLINNILHDRLFGTDFASANEGWLKTVDANLLSQENCGPLFFFGTQPNSSLPAEQKSLGADIWSLFLMSGVVPDKVRSWFGRWQHNITVENERAWVEIAASETKGEFSSTLLATAWAFATAKELGERELANGLRATLDSGPSKDFVLDPLLSGLYLLGEVLQPGAFRRLIVGSS